MLATSLIWTGVCLAPCSATELGDWYYREGPLRGSLKSDRPLPLYDSEPGHLWNRLFAVFYIRPSELPSRPEYPGDSTKLDEWDRKLRSGKLPLGPVVSRFEGGDTMSFLAWPRTRYYSEPETFRGPTRCWRSSLPLTASGWPTILSSGLFSSAICGPCLIT